MKKEYRVPKMETVKEIKVQVPGSKSITNRALLLAALSDVSCTLHGILLSDDSRAFLESLKRLGYELRTDEENREVRIQGTGGVIPNSHARINVRSAGTAARFLTVMLAIAGGEYEMEASPQMCRRPMQPLLDILRQAGVQFVFRGEEGHFPFRMFSEGISLEEVCVDTGISSQFASALLMSGVMLDTGLKVILKGGRASGSYIKMTLAMMRQFGIPVKQEGNVCQVPCCRSFGREEYQVEPDISGACYFYALAPLMGTNVVVKNVHEDSLQGDISFLRLLVNLGCRMKDEEEGILISGEGMEKYPGLEVSMKDFSDQTMTMAVLAPFASGPTLIRDVGHIRFQESDRIGAILTELERMGIQCEEVPDAEGIRIFPGEVQECRVETYEDHRMAMAFTLIGLKTGRITILDPDCCKKTFENYFELIDQITK